MYWNQTYFLHLKYLRHNLDQTLHLFLIHCIIQYVTMCLINQSHIWQYFEFCQLWKFSHSRNSKQKTLILTLMKLQSRSSNKEENSLEFCQMWNTLQKQKTQPNWTNGRWVRVSSLCTPLHSQSAALLISYHSYFLFDSFFLWVSKVSSILHHWPVCWVQR